MQNILQQADSVCFDFDSTVIQEESLDELAKFYDKAEDVIHLTNVAMDGKLTLQESLVKSLDIVQPSLPQLQRFIQTCPFTLTPGIEEFVQLLHDRQVSVSIISGGFVSIIEPIAKQLNIPLSNVFANKLKFFYDGDYAGFDETAYTAQNGGKAAVINLLKETYGYKNVVHIGDGITDIEAAPPADAVIGFGGNVVRENVKKQSQWFVMDINELIELFN